MVTDTLVDEQIEDGGELLAELPAHVFEVTAAFWIKAAEDGKWRFYLASRAVEADGIAQAYRRLHPLVRRMPQPFWIDPLEVKLISPSNPIAQDVLAIHCRVGGAHACPIRWGGIRLGHVSIEGAYLYPLPAGAAA